MISLPTAGHPLSDSEIESLFGDLMAQAAQAFREDPELVVRMAEDARALKRKGTLAKRRRAENRHVERLARDQEIVRLRLEGTKIAEIGEVVGLSERAVSTVLRNHGLTFNRGPHRGSGGQVTSDTDRTLQMEVIDRLARIETTLSGMVTQHTETDSALKEHDVRISRLERVVWIASGFATAGGASAAPLLHVLH